MGWNDRIEHNPYEPYPDYTEQDHYEAWMQYLNECQKELGLSSQNIDPTAALRPTDDLPASRSDEKENAPQERGAQGMTYTRQGPESVT